MAHAQKEIVGSTADTPTLLTRHEETAVRDPAPAQLLIHQIAVLEIKASRPAVLRSHVAAYARADMVRIKDQQLAASFDLPPQPQANP
jgi:hypothetical protein